MNITKRFLLVSLSLFMLGIVYIGCEDKSAVDRAMGEAGQPGIIMVSGEVDDKGIHVWSNAKDNGDGSSWENAYNDLQKAIEAAKAAKNKVYVAQGTYKPTSYPNGGNSEREKHFSLRNGVEVIGGYSGNGKERSTDPSKTILSGDIGKEDNISDNVYNVFYHPDGPGLQLDNTAKLTGVTITRGNANGSDDNDSGGGMRNISSSPELNNCKFIENKAKDAGGGMRNQDGSKPKLTNCQFSNNEAGYGGGMHNDNSKPTLNNCRFIGNKANNSGGGIRNHRSSLTITGCQFNNNKAVYGGGVINFWSSLTLSNCTFTNNTATNSGGAMFSDATSEPDFVDNPLIPTNDAVASRNNGYYKE